MTREEAIEIIRREYKCVDRDCDIERSCSKCDLMMPTKEPILKAYEMAISALEQNERAEEWYKLFVKKLDKQEPCEDAVSRAEAQAEIMMSKSITAFDRDLWIKTKDVVQILRELPSVTPKKITKEDLTYALKTCAYTVHNGQVMYEENDLIKRFGDLPSVTPIRRKGHIELKALIDKHRMYRLAYDELSDFERDVLELAEMVEPQESEGK